MEIGKTASSLLPRETNPVIAKLYVQLLLPRDLKANHEAFSKSLWESLDHFSQSSLRSLIIERLGFVVSEKDTELYIQTIQKFTHSEQVLLLHSPLFTISAR